MNLPFDNRQLRALNLFLAPIAIVWSVMSGMSGFLSHTNAWEYITKDESFFELFVLGDKFAVSEKITATSSGKTVNETVLVAHPHKLKAILRSSQRSLGVISDGNSSSVVAVGELYKKNYRLLRVSDDAVFLRGNGKFYTLKLGKEGTLDTLETVSRFIPDLNKKQGYERHSVARKDILAKMENITKLNQEIAITPQILGAQAGGFRVDFISGDSLFAQLGVLQGDVIQSINNRPLLSYSDALLAYNKLPQMRSIQIVVRRNNQPKELLYEIIR